MFKMPRYLAFTVLSMVSKVFGQAVALKAPATLPSGSSQVASHDFSSLAYEFVSFPDYAGGFTCILTGSAV